MKNMEKINNHQKLKIFYNTYFINNSFKMSQISCGDRKIVVVHVGLKVGDVVVLTSKGAYMTVIAIDATGQLTTCWVGNGPDATSKIMGPLPASCFLPAYSALRRKFL